MLRMVLGRDSDDRVPRAALGHSSHQRALLGQDGYQCAAQPLGLDGHAPHAPLRPRAALSLEMQRRTMTSGSDGGCTGTMLARTDRRRPVAVVAGGRNA